MLASFNEVPRMKLFFLVITVLIVLWQVEGKLEIEKVDVQYDKSHLDVKYSVKDKTSVSFDVHSLADGDDITVRFPLFAFKAYR
jgi:hypothetical protein